MINWYLDIGIYCAMAIAGWTIFNFMILVLYICWTYVDDIEFSEFQFHELMHKKLKFPDWEIFVFNKDAHGMYFFFWMLSSLLTILVWPFTVLIVFLTILVNLLRPLRRLSKKLKKLSEHSHNHEEN